MKCVEVTSDWRSLPAIHRIPPEERLPLLCFGLTSLQAAFQFPHINLIPGERAKVFAGLLCALSLISAAILAKSRSIRLPAPELAISLILLILAFFSGLNSVTTQASLLRGFVIMASSLGGFWCARLLLTSSSRQALFLWFCLMILGTLIWFSLMAHINTGRFYQYLDFDRHPLISRIMLLGFAPLTLVLVGRGFCRILGILLLGLSYAIFFLSTLRFAVMMPLFLGMIALLLGFMRPRYFFGLIFLILMVTIYFFHSFPDRKFNFTDEYEPVYYRLENYPFSWHIALKHPWLGNGLRAPRDMYLDDYAIKYPYVTKEKFTESVRHTVVSENIFLTFLAELGFPFVIIYSSSLIILFLRLIHWAKYPLPPILFPPMAILLPVTGGILYFQLFDGLFHPQVSWFFHILLGLIPGKSVIPACKANESISLEEGGR